MGALILEQGETLPGGVQSYDVVDGQQRLLTLDVLLSAIRDQIAFQGGSPVMPDNDLAKIKPTYAEPLQRFIPKMQDADALKAILGGAFVDSIDDDLMPHPLTAAYRYFRYQLWLGEIADAKIGSTTPPKSMKNSPGFSPGSFASWGLAARGSASFDLIRLDSILTTEMTLLELRIDATDEEAGVIFETMNAKQTPLAQFDLVRNSIFVRMPTSKSLFYSDQFAPVEQLLNKVTYSAKRDQGPEQFLYEYLISRGVAGVNKENLHRRWLNLVIEDVGYQVTPESEALFKDLHATPLVDNAWLYPLAVGHKSRVAPPNSQSVFVTTDTHTRIREIMSLSGGPAVPLVLKALYNRQQGHLTELETDLIIQNIQSFMVRHLLAGAGLNLLRGIFSGVASRLPEPITLKDFRSELGAAGWKTDKEVLAGVRSVNLRGLEKAIFIVLRGIERELSGISAHPMSPYGKGSADWQVEHIYPQTENVGPLWTGDLQSWGVNREDIDARRYSLGNLTAVTGFDNKKNGKKGFLEKKALIEKTANLKLHDSFKSAQKWTPEAIDERTDSLARAALLRWPRV